MTAAVGARPLVREMAQWRVWLPFCARALALQRSEPTVAAALVDHSLVFEDPRRPVARPGARGRGCGA